MIETSKSDIHAIPRRAQKTRPLNVGIRERWFSAAFGAGLIGWGAWRRGPLGFLSTLGGVYLAARGATGHCPTYAAFGLSTRSTPGDQRARLEILPDLASLDPGLTRIERTITVARPRDEVFRFLHDVSRIPHFVPHVSRVEELGDGNVQVWTQPNGHGPWTAHIERDEEARAIVLRHESAGQPAEMLSVLLAEAPGGRGTEVRITLDLHRQSSALRRALTAFAGQDPDILLRGDLRRMKMLLEAGEVVTTVGQAAGRGTPVMRMGSA